MENAEECPVAKKNIIPLSPKPGNPAQWIPYLYVDDVDATVKKTTKLRGKIAVLPFEVPTVGRIAVLVDPQGAVFGIIKPTM